jgi:hypothetical protein
MTIRTKTKETNTTDDIKKGSAKLTTRDECPTETDEHIAATVEDKPTKRDSEVSPGKAAVSPGKAACIDRTPSHKLLKVAQACNWGPGTTIYDDRDNAIFEVVFQRSVARAGMGGLDPIYEAVIMEIETREPVGYVRRVIEGSSDSYHVDMAYPIHSSQPITLKSEGGDFYALGILTQSMFGKNYVYKRWCDQELKFKTAMNASNGRIRFAFLCLCMLPFMCPRWLLKFYNVDDQKNPAIIRDQGDNTLTVAPGENLLEAICISYAVDRLTNPFNAE